MYIAMYTSQQIRSAIAYPCALLAIEDTYIAHIYVGRVYIGAKYVSSCIGGVYVPYVPYV